MQQTEAYAWLASVEIGWRELERERMRHEVPLADKLRLRDSGRWHEVKYDAVEAACAEVWLREQTQFDTAAFTDTDTATDVATDAATDFLQHLAFNRGHECA